MVYFVHTTMYTNWHVLYPVGHNPLLDLMKTKINWNWNQPTGHNLHKKFLVNAVMILTLPSSMSLVRDDTNCQLLCAMTTSNHSNVHSLSNLCNTSTFSNTDITFLLYSDPHQHVNHNFQTKLKHEGNKSVLETWKWASCVLLDMPMQALRHVRERCTSQCMKILTITFLWISENLKHKPTNQDGMI